jgi:hypothetical protein
MSGLISATAHAPPTLPKKGKQQQQKKKTTAKQAKPLAPLRPPRPHNHLLAHIESQSSSRSSLSERIVTAIESDGYIVLPKVFTSSECDEHYDKLWDFVLKTSPSLDRADPDTWYPDAKSAGAGAADPWVHSGFGNLPDMSQSFSAGWVFSDLRELLAERVFQPLYGTDRLHSSKEGFTFHRPTCGSVVSDAARYRHPNLDKPKPRVCGKESNTDGEHFDQRAADTGLQCIQSSTALLDQSEDDGCFKCWPGSHKLHATMTENVYRARNDWVALTDDELLFLRENGYEPKRVPVGKGDVILWRSDLCHCGVAPLRPVTTFRAVSYTCMLPASLTDSFGSEAMLTRKFQEYEATLTGDHRPDLPSMPHMQQPKSSGAELFKNYFEEGPPALTYRQAELYGLVEYTSGGDEEVAQRELAEARGVRFRR